MTQTFMANPEFLHLDGPGGRTLYGCDQDWFASFWQRKAGCGPCTLANIMRYLGRAGKLSQPAVLEGVTSCQALMEEMWGYVTPGMMGLNSTARFAQGAAQALEKAGGQLTPAALDIDQKASQEESARSAAEFIAAGLMQAPVAFLNLLRRQLGPLEPWHWVTVVGLSRSEEDATLHIYDNGLRFDLSLSRWLLAGGNGGFVSFA
ncbi:MAG: hypothetical protein PHP07_02530 [Eubacteriales bacterium]|nr:hypothetical protein [Eubacteriales bacterium]MDD4134159.1 hypothetical protein [Eubacteriales bacterium]